MECGPYAIPDRNAEDDSIQAIDPVQKTKSILENLAFLRKSRGYSVEDVISRSLLAKEVVDLIEDGNDVASFGAIIRYAAAIGVELWIDDLPGE